jgi:hypothetical protein
MKKSYSVKCDWDADARVWYVSETDIPGLATEAATVEAMTRILRCTACAAPSTGRWPGSSGSAVFRQGRTVLANVTVVVPVRACGSVPRRCRSAAAGLSRESLYRSLSAAGNPRLSTLVAVLRVAGLRLSVREAA